MYTKLIRNKQVKMFCFFNLVKDEDKKIVPMMNTPAGRLMKCFLRDLYMVKLLIYFLKILLIKIY